MLLVLDQFEQWLFARRGEEDTELVAALRQCDGEHVQAIVMVRDDFWMAATRFMRDLEIDLAADRNIAVVDLFGPRHARKVLTAFGRAYGALPERSAEFTNDHEAFLDQAIAGLAQDSKVGKVISVRLALFAEMVKEKQWVPSALREVGGTEGVGVTFLEETFAAPQANPKHRLHRKAAQAVLKALLPQRGTDIKGQMRSEAELREASGYAGRPRDFDELIHILDQELRLITPTEGVEGDGWWVEGEDTRHDPTDAEGGVVPSTLHAPPPTRYYQLTHDYLVPSLRDWLTRKQRETRRGRAELRLADRAALWEAKPENRHLPSVFEWANIRALTRRKDWTDPQRRMMRRAGRIHGLRTMALAALIALGTWGGVEAYGHLHSAELVASLETAGTADVPRIVERLARYRRWADPKLVRMLGETEPSSRAHLHARLALLPSDATQVDPLYDRLIAASPADLRTLVHALEPYKARLATRLWAELEKAGPVDPSLLASAGALALYDPGNARWLDLGGKVARALVSLNPILVGHWLEPLRPVSGKLTAPLEAIFREPSRPESEHDLATSILADYAKDEPDRVAGMLMVSDPKSFLTLFPVAEKQAAGALPLLQAELKREATFDWNDPPLDPSWTKPEPALASRIEAAQGLLAERFAFCQAMPLDDALAATEALRPSGYRAVRFRPYADGPSVRVAAVWARDGRKWRVASGLAAEEVRRQDEANRKERFIPVDVAGYVATEKDGKPGDRYAVLWVEASGGDEARLYAVATDDTLTALQKPLQDAKLTPRTLHASRGSDGRRRYCGVWGKPPSATVTAQGIPSLSEGNLAAEQLERSDQWVIDLAVTGAEPSRTAQERARASLETAEKSLKARPDDLDARWARATALIQLGDDRKALDDLNVVIEKAPQFDSARQYRAIIGARLGRKKEALDDLTQFQKGTATESARLYLAAVVAAELGEGRDEAFARLDAAIKRQPRDFSLAYDAACAYALASRAARQAGSNRRSRSMPSGLSNCSGPRSKTVIRTTITSRRTPTSTRSGTCPRSAS